MMEVVVREMRYTPELSAPLVFSEAAEVYRHGYSIAWDSSTGRRLTSPHSYTLDLFMSESKLGWVKVMPVTDVCEQERLLRLLRDGNCKLASALLVLDTDDDGHVILASSEYASVGDTGINGDDSDDKHATVVMAATMAMAMRMLIELMVMMI